MSLIVQKFGGSSASRMPSASATWPASSRRPIWRGNDVIVVLSAQGDTTDDLIAKAEEINPHASKREMDMLLSTGEQISVALCAMALEAMGLPCVSLAAWQVGIQSTSVHSDARIKKIDTERIQAGAGPAPDRDRHRLPGRGPQRRRHHPGPGRLRHQRRGAGGGLPGGSVPDLYGCGRRVHHGSPHRPQRPEAGRDHLRRDAGAGVAGRPGAPQPQRGAGQEVQSESGSRCPAWSASPARKSRRSQKWRKPISPASPRTPASPGSP